MKRKIVAGVILGVIVLLLVIALVTSRKNFGGRAIYGLKNGAVGVVSISGAIVSGKGSSGLWGVQVGSDDVTASLRLAARDPSIRAVVLRLNSPGGTAASAQEIAAEVDRLRRSGKKVVASMGDVCASGAYWIACRADRIVANPGTLTGSIGVIMKTQDLQELYDKIGINTETFKSGPHKDMGSPTRSLTQEERFIFQSMVDDIYEQFLLTVAEGRKMSLQKVKHLADGRIFTGRQAKKVGLVDELGNYREAIDLAGRLAGLGVEPRIIELGPKGLWQELFGNIKGSLHPAIWLKVGLGYER